MLNLFRITSTGTYKAERLEGVEFNELPPTSLKRALNKKYAESLINEGSIKLNRLKLLQEIEAMPRGDNNEGIGSYSIEGKAELCEQIHDAFIYCTAIGSIENEKLLEIFNDCDTVVEITNPLEFSRRIRCLSIFDVYNVHCGTVKYDRGTGLPAQTPMDLNWNFNMFQKDERYSEQQEYRFAVIKELLFGPTAADSDNIVINIGYCGDIASIVYEKPA